MKLTTTRICAGSHNVRCDGKRTAYQINEGSYHNTPDDRLGRWYIERAHANMVDRRGPGHGTIKDALNALELSLSV